MDGRTAVGDRKLLGLIRDQLGNQAGRGQPLDRHMRKTLEELVGDGNADLNVSEDYGDPVRPTQKGDHS